MLSKDDREKFVKKSLYLKLYKSGIFVFKNNPWFGVGNKNYFEAFKGQQIVPN